MIKDFEIRRLSWIIQVGPVKSAGSFIRGRFNYRRGLSNALRKAQPVTAGFEGR